MRTETTDVVITGAGPAGSVAAGILRKQGHRVMVLERETLPVRTRSTE
jgi:flavin-dependent dehydrogenase